jgi:hypothetical protein
MRSLLYLRFLNADFDFLPEIASITRLTASCFMDGADATTIGADTKQPGDNKPKNSLKIVRGCFRTISIGLKVRLPVHYQPSFDR